MNIKSERKRPIIKAEIFKQKKRKVDFNNMI